MVQVLSAAQLSPSPTVAVASADPALPKHLLRACKDNDAQRAAELLGIGIDIEHRGMWGNTPLLCATAYGSASVAELLVSRGADCTVVNEDGATPLMLACLEGLQAAVAGMLARPGGGLDLWPPAATVYSRAVDSASAQTPLRAACEGGHQEIVRMLIDNGVLASAPSKVAVGSAMVSAARNDHVQVVLALLEAGVAATTPDEAGTTAAEAATVDVAEILAEHAEHAGYAAECNDRADRAAGRAVAPLAPEPDEPAVEVGRFAASEFTVAINSGLDSARAASPAKASFIAHPPPPNALRAGAGVDSRPGMDARKHVRRPGSLPPLRTLEKTVVA
eukprot:COSAG05_NODE_2470_length_3023_cov_2.592339_3_plen_334_part_00